jgi:hypothetical protein
LVCFLSVAAPVEETDSERLNAKEGLTLWDAPVEERDGERSERGGFVVGVG